MNRNFKKYNNYNDYCTDSSSSDSKNNNDTSNLMLYLVKSVNDNTNVVSKLLTQIQTNVQFQRSNDASSLENIGNNDVNVIGFIDPDTISGATANNESNLNNTANAEGNAISLALTLAIKNIINQLGLVNITDNNNS